MKLSPALVSIEDFIGLAEAMPLSEAFGERCIWIVAGGLRLAP